MKKMLQWLVPGLMVLALLAGINLVDGFFNTAEAAGTIRGYVKRYPAFTGSVGGATVTAHNVTTGETASATSGATYGLFEISNLPAGDYNLEVNTNGHAYLGQFYDNKETLAEADIIEVIDGATTPDIYVYCIKGGTIQGRVTEANTTDGIPYVTITAYNITYGLSPNFLTDDSIYQSQVGYYTIEGLETGSYMVTATPVGLNYVWEIYSDTGGTFNPYEATYVEVTEGGEGDATGINFALQPGGSISGIVTSDNNPGGEEEVYVLASACEGTLFFNSAYTAVAEPDTGKYTIFGLVPGDSYLISATKQGDFMGRYYKELETGTQNLYDATYVEVPAAGDTIPNIDIHLPVGGMIAGRVDAPDDDLDMGYFVTATEVNSGSYRTAETLEGGVYTIHGLKLGSYLVSVSIAGTEYIKQYYNEVHELESTTPVEVTEANKTTAVPDINFNLVIGGSISGTILSDLDGSPVPGVVVYAYKSENGYYGTGVTQKDGTYTIVGLKGGDYKMQVNAQGSQYAGEYYNNTFIFDEASLVTVTQGLETSGIDFSLAAGGAISGTVTDGIGDPVGNVVVTAYDLQDTGDYGTALTDQETGVYTITGLLPAEYKIEVDDLYVDRGYVRQYYNGVATYEAATPVTVTSGATIGSIDLTLSSGGTISGTVYQSDGVTPLTGPPIQIIVFTGELCARSNQAAVRTGYTKACTGEYTIKGIPPGDVYVRAVWYDYGTEWWKASSSTQVCYQAEAITIAADVTTPNINFQLDPDTDNDYLTDGLEITIGTDPNNNDSDGDGIFDGLENRVHDTIIDPARNETDPLDPDTDDDELYDGTEKGLVAPQGGGTPAYFIADADPATTTDANDPDTDGDGIQDGNEDLNHNGLFEPDLGETDPNTPEVVAAVGDLDSDADVDGVDLATLAGTFGSCPGCPGDLNDDDVINAADLTFFAGTFGAAN